MRRLTKSQREALLRHVAAIEQKQQTLEAAIDAFNAAMTHERALVEGALESLNSVIADADAFRDEIQTDMEALWDDRSEKWQESDAGAACSDWMDAWRDSFEEIEVEFPDEIEHPENSVVERIENLPDQP